jgi:hypothetical protein
MLMIVRGGDNFASQKSVNVEIVAPGVGKIACLECRGNSEGYAASFGPMRLAVAPNGCIDCKGRGWVYISA